MNPENLPPLRVVLYTFFRSGSRDPAQRAGVGLDAAGFPFHDKDLIKSVIAAIDDALAHPEYVVSALLPYLPATEEEARQFLVEVRTRFLTLDA